MASFSKKELSQLRGLMAQARITPKPPAAKKKKKPRPKVPRNMSEGFRLSYSEILPSIAIKKGNDSLVQTADFFPDAKIDGKLAFPVFNKLMTVFESYKIHSLSIEWASSSATTTSGMVVIGIDVNTISKVDSFDKATQLKPSMKFPVWTQNRALRIPQVHVQPSLLRYPTNSHPNVPFAIVAAIKAGAAVLSDSAYGSFSVKWDISFIGISPG